MDFETMLTDLRAEVRRLTEAITVIESLRLSSVGRRGRPRKEPIPKSVNDGAQADSRKPESTP